MKSLVLLIAIIIVSSCSEPFPTVVSNYSIENKSGYDISLILYNKINDTINIPSNNNYTIVKKYDGEIANPFECDSIGIAFNSLKKVVYNWRNNSTRNLLLVENYSKEKIGNNAYALKYLITVEDFENIQN